MQITGAGRCSILCRCSAAAAAADGCCTAPSSQSYCLHSDCSGDQRGGATEQPDCSELKKRNGEAVSKFIHTRPEKTVANTTQAQSSTHAHTPPSHTRCRHSTETPCNATMCIKHMLPYCFSSAVKMLVKKDLVWNERGDLRQFYRHQKHLTLFKS